MSRRFPSEDPVEDLDPLRHMEFEDEDAYSIDDDDEDDRPDWLDDEDYD